MCQRRGARLVSRSVPLESGFVRIDARTGTRIATHRHAQTIRAPRKRHSSARSAPQHFAPGRLVLAHLARTRSCVLGPRWRAPLPVFPAHFRAAGVQPCRSTGVLEMPSIAVHRLVGMPPSSPCPANTTRALVASLRFRPHAPAIAASTRTSNPACSGLAQLRCARH